MKKNRESGIELLRIVLMIGVILLHFNDSTNGNAINLVEKFSLSWFILMILENIFIYAVDIFIIISGYFLCKSNKRSFIKVIELFLELIIIRLLKYFILIIIGEKLFSIKSLMTLFIPNSYFVVLYCVLYLISPYINVVLNKLKQKDLKKLLIMLIIIFCCWNTIGNEFENIVGKSFMGLSTVGAWGSQQGFNIVNFIVLYLVGTYLKINDVKISFRKIKLLLILEIVLIGWSILEKIYLPYRIAWYYDNPIIVVNAAIIFLIFKNIKIKSKVINELAKGSFTVFLINSIFIRKVDVIVKFNPLFMVFCMFGIAIGTYIFGYLLYKFYGIISIPINKLLSKYKDKFEYVVE